MPDFTPSYTSSQIPEPHYIWTHDGTPTETAGVVFFRYRFSLEGEPAEGTLNLFGDTRYRLIVNGVTVGHGPARFHIPYPEFDTWDITPFLQAGENLIAVAVHNLGRNTFSSDKSIGGLIAWGEYRAIDHQAAAFASGDGWKAQRATAYATDTIALAFQLPASELLDARELPIGWETVAYDDSDWPSAVILRNQDHWGELLPRSIPLLDEREVWPKTSLGTFVPEQTEPVQTVSLRTVIEELGFPFTHPNIAFLTFIHSPREQKVTLSISDGRHWLNGEELIAEKNPNFLWRTDIEVELRKGWNSWLALDLVTRDACEWALQWPAEAGLTVSGRQTLDGPPDAWCSGAFEEGLPSAERFIAGFTPLFPRFAANEGRPEDFKGPFDFLVAWKLHNLETELPSPFAARAWEKMVPIESGNIGDAQAVAVLYDFGTEVLGRPYLEFSAPAGTVVDVLYTERLKDGQADFSTQGTRMAERYISREGRQSWHLFHPRGMRYLELVVRGDCRHFELHHIGLTRANYSVRDIGRFECSDPVLNDIWRIGRDTLYACMEDGYLDCPWRERGVYTGDALVQFYSNLAVFGDGPLARRSILQIFETQGEETGLLAPCSHGLPDAMLPDYSAIIIQCVWHYWARTGDAEFVRRLEPRIRRLLDGLRAIEEPGLNLVDTANRFPYVDLSHIDAIGINLAGNCFHQRAFDDAARLFSLLDDEAEAARCAGHAAAIADAIQAAFWSEERGVFLDRRVEDVPDTKPSTLGNVLPLLYDIAKPEQGESTLDFVLETIENLEVVPGGQATADFNLTTYSSFYAVGLLYEAGKAEEAEAYIRKRWGAVLAAGAATFWEYFLPHWSLCHAWSTCPTHYLSSEVLGVRYATPGEPNDVIIAPQPGTLQWASGVYPHPAGPIRVEWQRRGEQLLLEYEVPDDVSVVQVVSSCG